MKNNSLVKIVELDFPTQVGDFIMEVYQTKYESQPDMKYALLLRTKKTAPEPLVRIHSKCLFGESFFSSFCDCREQLTESMKEIHKQNGLLFYLDQEAMGNGLFAKSLELAKKEELINDQREYVVVVDMLTLMNIHQIKLLTNSLKKLSAFESSKIKVEQVSF